MGGPKERMKANPRVEANTAMERMRHTARGRAKANLVGKMKELPRKEQMCCKMKANVQPAVILCAPLCQILQLRNPAKNFRLGLLKKGGGAKDEHRIAFGSTYDTRAQARNVMAQLKCCTRESISGS